MMNDIFNFAQQQMDNYSARFGAVDPMQQDVTFDCGFSCMTRCKGSCSETCYNGCLYSCHHGCHHSCKHACDSGGYGTQRRGW